MRLPTLWNSYSKTGLKFLRKSFRRTSSIKKVLYGIIYTCQSVERKLQLIFQSLTAPDFSQTKPNHLEESLDLEDSVFESQFDSAKGSTNILNKSSSKASLYSSLQDQSSIRANNQTSKLCKVNGIAIPPDVFQFLRVQHNPKPSKSTKVDRVGRIYPNVDGGVSHLVKEQITYYITCRNVYISRNNIEIIS